MAERGEDAGTTSEGARAEDSTGSGARGRLGRTLILVGIVGVAAFLRLAALSADPPSSLSRDFISDEAWWAHNARNHALFGVWCLDDFNQGLFAAPLHSFLERLCFISGVHVWQIRIVSVLAGLGTILSIGVILQRGVGFRGAAIGMAILATDYFCVLYDRAGFVEPLPTAFMALAFVFATWPTRRRGWLFLAGMSTALACLAKINSVFFTIVPLAWPLIRTVPAANRRERATDVLAVVAGLAIPLLIFGLAFVLPNLPEYLSQNGRLREESKINGIWLAFNLFTVSIQEWKGGLILSGIMTQALLPTMLGLLWLLHALSQAARHGFRRLLTGLTDAERIALLWIGAFIPYFVLQNNSQDRRYYVFVAPLTLLGAQLLAGRRDERIELHTADLHPNRALIVLAACSLVLGVYLRVPLADALYWGFRNWMIGNTPGLSLTAATVVSTGLMALILVPALWYLLRQVPRPGLTTMTAALILVVAGGTFQLSRFLRQAASTSYSLQDASRRFAAHLRPEDRVVDGHPLILESRCRNLILLDRRNVGYPYYGIKYLDEYHPTHRLVINSVPTDATTFDDLLRREMGGNYRCVPESLETFPVYPDETGRMQIVFTLARIVTPEPTARHPSPPHEPPASGTPPRPRLAAHP